MKPSTVFATPVIAPTQHQATAVQWNDLLAHREFLLNFASRKLHDPALAEDVVQDVFEAVIAGRAEFGGESALRTWMAGILKHKIVDLIRQRAGLDCLAEDLDSDACQAMECHQPRPDTLAEQRQTLRQVMQGIAKLPQGLRDVMELRVLQEESTAHVCQTLAISENNLFQRLFKARRVLALSLPMAMV